MQTLDFIYNFRENGEQIKKNKTKKNKNQQKKNKDNHLKGL